MKSSKRLVRPLHVLEREHRRVRLGEPLEEDAPARANRSCCSCVCCSVSPSRCASLGSTKLRSSASSMMLVEYGACSFVSPGAGLVVLGDAAAHPHHVGERPVRDAVAVGQAAAAVPVDGSLRCRRSTCRTPTTSRDLPMPPMPVTETSCALPSLRRGVEEILDRAQLAVASDERRLEAVATSASRAVPRRRVARATAASGRPCPSARSCPRRRTRSSASRRAARRLADEHRAGLGADWTRDAVLTRSPATIPWPSAPSVTAASPVSTPARARSSSAPSFARAP